MFTKVSPANPIELTLNYTRMIEVYTPAIYSSTGQDVVLGTFDGNSSSDIAACLSTWGWNSSTKEAIRQAASSSLTFTTGLPVDCTAVWIDTSTGKQLYSKAFGSGSVNKSQSVIVSVSYSEYTDSGKYVYESLAYSGDSTGTSTAQSYSQTYKATSKPLTVTFYCHPQVTTGSITVKAIDGDTLELIPDADITCGGKTAPYNPYTFTDVELGTYTASASADGYYSNSGKATISRTSYSTNITIYLDPIPKTGDITVTVLDSSTYNPIYGATVSGCGSSKTTNVSGKAYFYDVFYGGYTFTASASGYYSGTGYASISDSYSTDSVTIYLDPLPTSGDITVYVKDKETGSTISGAYVSGSGRSGNTNSNGKIEFTGLNFGTHTFTATASEYGSGI